MPVIGKFRPVLENMPKEQWYTLEEVYKFVEDNMVLKEDDWEIPEGKYIPRWKMCVRAILHHMKTQGYVEHDYRITKGEIINETIPALYKFCIDKNENVTTRDTNRTKYFDALMSMDKNTWYTLEEIYEFVEYLDIINDEEYEQSKPDNPMPIWKHRIYTALGHMKNRGYAEHKKAVAKVNSPTGKKIPAMYKFI